MKPDQEAAQTALEQNFFHGAMDLFYTALNYMVRLTCLVTMATCQEVCVPGCISITHAAAHVLISFKPCYAEPVSSIRQNRTI